MDARCKDVELNISVCEEGGGYSVLLNINNCVPGLVLNLHTGILYLRFVEFLVDCKTYY